jgi:hypothetical protein
LLSTEGGHTFHDCLQCSPKKLIGFDYFVSVLNTNEQRPILDIKMAKILNK